MKKLLLILFLLSLTVSFAQQKEMGSTIIKKNELLSTLSQVSAYPNPLTFKTKINFQSNKDQLLEFTVKNLLGKTVYRERMNAKKGINAILFNRDDLAKGMYIYSLQTETEIISKRLVIR
tara:strand:- start:215 stop:574 length:360 start_codon:yes stop_codon:yes gene_type:complete